MIELRQHNGLGGNNLGWLDTKHHFSFADYVDPQRMGWGKLWVLNDDTILPHTGFAPHPHKNMEIITYVRAGAISHKDSLGNMGRTEAGHVQVMTAGTGIVHEEFNAEDVTTQIFQIWLLPKALGLAPRWGSKAFPQAPSTAAALTLLASGQENQPHALPLNAEGDIYGGSLCAGTAVTHSISLRRCVYVVIASGHVRIDGLDVHAGDALAIKDERAVTLEAAQDSTLLLIDVAP